MGRVLHLGKCPCLACAGVQVPTALLTCSSQSILWAVVWDHRFPGGVYPSPIELGCLGAQAPGSEYLRGQWELWTAFPAERAARTHGAGRAHVSEPKQESHEGFSLQEFFIYDPVLKTSELRALRRCGRTEPIQPDFTETPKNTLFSHFQQSCE